MDIDDIIDKSLGIEPDKPTPVEPEPFAFDDPMKELPRLGVQPQKFMPMTIAPPKRLSTDMTMDEMEASSKLAEEELQASMMTHRPQQGSVLGRYDRSVEEHLIDLMMGGDTRKVKRAMEMGEPNVYGKLREETYDPAIDPAFYGTDALLGFGLPKALTAYGKGAAKLAGSPEELTGALKKYSGGAIDVKPMYARDTEKTLSARIDANLGDLPEMLKPQSGTGADEIPEVWFHGTDADFKEFRDPEGIAGHFTKERAVAEGYGGRVIEANIDVKNPKIIMDEDWRMIRDKQGYLSDLKRQGYDSVISDDTGDIIPFYPNQIKQLTTPEMLKPQSGAPSVTAKQAGEYYEIENVQQGNERIRAIQEQARNVVSRPEQSEGIGIGVQTGDPAQRTAVLPRQTIGTKVIEDDVNYAKQIGNEYQRSAGIEPTPLSSNLESSIGKQASVAQAFENIPRFSDNSPKAVQTKQAVFDTYVQTMPEVFKQTSATNYDELIQEAYAQAEKETDAMFKTLPVKMRYHQHDEGNYPTSDALRDDVRNNNTMNVYQGGEPHEFWSAQDPLTGLNSNEKFRAVHDYYGHSIDTNEFGRMGEERATDVHAQMYSPLARLALYAETRGQNSWVNYSKANLPMRQRQKELRESIADAKHKDPDSIPALKQELKDTWKDFQFAEQKAILLPAQMVRPDFDGLMPENVRSTLQREGKETMGTHYSTQKDIETLDPAAYGTGSAGHEKSYAADLPDELKPVHFYMEGAKPEGQVVAKSKSMTQAPLRGLYDLVQDPDNFRGLAAEHGGKTEDLYRQVHAAGYEGFHDGNVAVTFGKRDVKKVADLEGMTPQEKMKARPEPELSPNEVIQPEKVTVKPKTIKRSTTVKHMSRAEAEAEGYWHPVGDGKKLKKPVSQFQFETVHAHDEVPKKIIMPEDLFGGIILPASGDRTNSGRLLNQVGGHTFKKPVHLEGGNGFMKDNPDGIWASDQGVITKLNSTAKPFIDQGRDAFMLYLPMKHKATNFSAMMTDALYGQIMSGDVSKTAKQMFDRRVRKLRPEWKGLDHEDAVNQLHANGELRHAFADVANLEDFQRRGFPDLGETRYSITDPDLLDTPLHHGGQAIGKMDGTVVQSPKVPHTTYNTTMGGEYVGGFADGVPRNVLFPSFYKQRRAEGKPESRDYRAFSMQKIHQEADQEWLDSVMKYLEENK